MEPYGGFEPQVGEIRAVRTFRIGPGATLYPLFSDHAWTSAINTAHCRMTAHDGLPPAAHIAPDPDCTCGFYAYADRMSAMEYPHARHVLAVVAMWGRVIAGTRGIRAQHARIEAIWMSAAVPSELARAVAARYPTTSIYTDADQMFADHRPTRLDCYEDDPAPPGPLNALAVRLALPAAIVVGLLPAGWLAGPADVRTVWTLVLGLGLIGAAVGRRRRSDVAGRRRMLLLVATALWLLAPLAGSAGVLFLRLPMLEVFGLTAVLRYRIVREARRFPARI